MMSTGPLTNLKTKNTPISYLSLLNNEDQSGEQQNSDLYPLWLK